MPVSGLIAVFVILGLFLSMLTSAAPNVPSKEEKSSSDTSAQRFRTRCPIGPRSNGPRVTICQ